MSDRAQGLDRATVATPAVCAGRELEVEAWRRRIDLIDTQLMGLLNSRSACAVEIGRLKRLLGVPIYAPEREVEILERVMRENPGPLDPLAVRRVFERIIDESRRLEREAAEATALVPPAGTGTGQTDQAGSRELERPELDKPR